MDLGNTGYHLFNDFSLTNKAQTSGTHLTLSVSKAWEWIMKARTLIHKSIGLDPASYLKKKPFFLSLLLGKIGWEFTVVRTGKGTNRTTVHVVPMESIERMIEDSQARLDALKTELAQITIDLDAEIDFSNDDDDDGEADEFHGLTPSQGQAITEALDELLAM